MTAIIVWVLEKTIGFRVTEDDEAAGVDLVLHAETAYDLHAATAGGRPHFGGSTERRGDHEMKLITAVIRPHRWENVREALEALGVSGMTLTEVSGYGRQKGHTEVYRGAEYDVLLVPKVRIEIVAEDPDVEQIIAAIQSSAATGKIGDGKIWVSPVESVQRVRTGETGAAAI